MVDSKEEGMVIFFWNIYFNYYWNDNSGIVFETKMAEFHGRLVGMP